MTKYSVRSVSDLEVDLQRTYDSPSNCAVSTHSTETHQEILERLAERCAAPVAQTSDSDSEPCNFSIIPCRADRGECLQLPSVAMDGRSRAYLRMYSQRVAEGVTPSRLHILIENLQNL